MRRALDFGAGPMSIWLVVVLPLAMSLACDVPDRGEEMSATAAEFGMSYAEKLSPALAVEMNRLPSMSFGGQNHFVHMISSSDLVVFDWTWREGPLKERNRESQTIVAVRRAGESAIAPFVWVERGKLGRDDRRRFGEPIDWEDVPVFSDRNAVASADRAATRELFSSASRGRLELPAGLRVEGAGPWLIGFRPGARLEVAQLRSALDEMQAIAATLVSERGTATDVDR